MSSSAVGANPFSVSVEAAASSSSTYVEMEQLGQVDLSSGLVRRYLDRSYAELSSKAFLKDREWKRLSESPEFWVAYISLHWPKLYKGRWPKQGVAPEVVAKDLWAIDEILGQLRSRPRPIFSIFAKSRREIAEDLINRREGCGSRLISRKQLLYFLDFIWAGRMGTSEDPVYPSFVELLRRMTSHREEILDLALSYCEFHLKQSGQRYYPPTVLRFLVDLAALGEVLEAPTNPDKSWAAKIFNSIYCTLPKRGKRHDPRYQSTVRALAEIGINCQAIRTSARVEVLDRMTHMLSLERAYFEGHCQEDFSRMFRLTMRLSGRTRIIYLRSLLPTFKQLLIRNCSAAEFYYLDRFVQPHVIQALGALACERETPPSVTLAVSATLDEWIERSGGHRLAKTVREMIATRRGLQACHQGYCQIRLGGAWMPCGTDGRRH